MTKSNFALKCSCPTVLAYTIAKKNKTSDHAQVSPAIYIHLITHKLLYLLTIVE